MELNMFSCAYWLFGVFFYAMNIQLFGHLKCADIIFLTDLRVCRHVYWKCIFPLLGEAFHFLKHVFWWTENLQF